MSGDLPASAQRVQDYLAARGVACHVRTFPESTRTAQEAADAIGCEIGQIAKSLIFRDAANDRPVLIVASGANRVDVGKVEAVLGVKLTRADGKWVKARVGFAIGGVPPVAHDERLATVLDSDLWHYETLWAAAGTPFAIFEMDAAVLGELTGGRWTDLAE